MSPRRPSGFAPRILTAALLATLPATAHGQAPPEATQPGNGRLAWLAVGGALTATFFLDQEARREVYLEEGQDLRGLAEFGNALATPQVVVPAIGGAYLAGRLLDRPGLSEGALHAVLGLAASEAATDLLKVVVGRPRPYVGTADGDDLRPLAFDRDYQAFPSGHVTAAFSLATTVAMESDRRWIATLAYGAATLDAWARIHDDQHWLSDTAMGALVGTVATRMTRDRLHRGDHATTDALRIAYGPRGVQLTLPVP